VQLGGQLIEPGNPFLQPAQIGQPAALKRERPSAVSFTLSLATSPEQRQQSPAMLILPLQGRVTEQAARPKNTDADAWDLL